MPSMLVPILSSGKVAVINNTVMSALNNFTNEKKYSVLYSIQINDFCFLRTPPKYLSKDDRGFASGRGFVAASWGSCYISNLPEKYSIISIQKPKAKAFRKTFQKAVISNPLELVAYGRTSYFEMTATIRSKR